MLVTVGRWSVVLFAILVSCVMACGGPPVPPPNLADQSAPVGLDPEFEYTPEYRIRVGDRMRIEFLSDPEPATSASTVIVRPDGRISLRNVDDVLAAGLTPAELDSVLTVRFARLLVDPELSVIVEDFARERIFILGEVARPQEIPLRGPMSLTQALSAAGGLTIKANRNNIVVIRRKAQGGLDAFMVDAEPIMEGQPGAREISLLAQDVVIVPKSGIAKVGDFVSLYFENLNPLLLSIFWANEIVRRN
jgi:polysaccharide export outer membrane protein